MTKEQGQEVDEAAPTLGSVLGPSRKKRAKVGAVRGDGVSAHRCLWQATTTKILSFVQEPPVSLPL